MEVCWMSEDKRISKIECTIKQAKDLALRSPCIGRRRFGSIIIKDDAEVSSGYNGSVRNALNCGIDIPCLQNLKGAEHNKDYSTCCAIHSEQNAIINAARLGHAVLGATLVLAEANGKGDRPCRNCRAFMINAGIYDCYYEDRDGSIKHEILNPYWVQLENEWILENKAKIEKQKADEANALLPKVQDIRHVGHG